MEIKLKEKQAKYNKSSTKETKRGGKWYHEGSAKFSPGSRSVRRKGNECRGRNNSLSVLYIITYSHTTEDKMLLEVSLHGCLWAHKDVPCCFVLTS